MSKTDRRPGTVSGFLIVGASVFACPWSFAASADPESAGARQAARTQFVLSSNEPIHEPYVTAATLPRTLSIHPFSDAEIDTIRRQIYEQVKDREPHKVDGIDGCMQWLLMRPQGMPAWKAFGFGFGRAGTIKLNGAWRNAAFDYEISPVAIDGTSLRGPGTKPGSGRTYVALFRHQTSAIIGSNYLSEDSVMTDKIFRGGLGDDARYLEFLETSQLVIEAQNAPCTYMKQQCRRYVFSEMGPMKWVGRRSQDGATASVYQDIATERSARLEIAIEDPCPFTRFAMVERPINTRTRSAEVGVNAYGIPNNPSLKNALAPHVMGPSR